jgi:hypothetical protein
MTVVFPALSSLSREQAGTEDQGDQQGRSSTSTRGFVPDGPEDEDLELSL